MHKMLAITFCWFFFSAAEDNTEKIYESIEQLTSQTIKPQVSKCLPKNQSCYTYYF